MADPLSTSSAVVALVTFAFQCSVTLYETVRGFQSQDKKARALKAELGELNAVLESLLETVKNNPDIDFTALERPLRRCGKACQEYGDIIARCTKYSTGSRPSIRDWITQKYLQGDITDFKDMLATYKSTINIALANANIRVSAITPKVLEDYQEVIRDTTNDLQEHLQRLEEKVQILTVNNTDSPEQGALEWEAMLEEKESTQQGLRICAQLTAQIELLEKTPKEHPQFSGRASAQKYVRSGLSVTSSSIESLVSRLQNHETDIDQQMEAMKSTFPISESTVTQLARLQETKESIRQCINVVAGASNNLVVERRNVFEDITMADDTYDFSVSTVGELVTARRINLKGRAKHVGGQITDESYQKTIDAFTQLDMAKRSSHSPGSSSDRSRIVPKPGGAGSEGNEFHGRHGPGIPLALSKES